MWIVVVVEAFVILLLVARLLKPHTDGRIVVTETDEKKSFALEFDADPYELDKQRHVVLGVERVSVEAARE